MVKSKIFLSTPHKSGKEILYFQEALFRNELTPYGKNIIQFEQDLEFYLKNKKKVVCLSSGTAALHLALILSGVKLNDEVLCQSMTFSATANPIVYQGAKPIFIDSEEETWNMCPNHLEIAIKDRVLKGKKPKAIIVVHLYGMPAKMEEIVAIAKRYDIALIEDSAEALGSTYKGQKCGTLGDFGILSFNGNKIITTSGGGALVCATDETKQRTIFLATQARENAPHYQHSEIGYNYRISNINAGIGCGQMEVLDDYIELRRRNNQFYNNLFQNIKGVTVFSEPTKDHFSNHWLSCIVIDKFKAGFNREDLRLALIEQNIESRPLWKPMHLQPVFRECEFYGKFVAENLFNDGLCLPSGSNLTQIERDRIKDSVLEFILKR